MDCFPLPTRAALVGAGQVDLVSQIEDWHTKLLKRRRKTIQVKGHSWTKYRSARADAEVLQQALLRRTDRLTGSCGTALAHGDNYGCALMARGHLETSALLGYLAHQTNALADGKMSAEEYDGSVKALLFGSRDAEAEAAGMPKAVNILTCIKKADQFMRKHPGYGGSSVVSDAYQVLSEFAHPNMLSHSLSIKHRGWSVDLASRHDLGSLNYDLLNWLLISLMLFVDCFDAVDELHSLISERSANDP